MFLVYKVFDRIDLQIEIHPLSFDELSRTHVAESSASIRERVLKARQIQTKRFEAYNNNLPPYEGGMGRVSCNAQMTPALMREFCALDDRSLKMLQNAMSKLDLSARAYDRILRVARTIADYEGCENINSTHIAEAISYRNLDRNSWGQG